MLKTTGTMSDSNQRRVQRLGAWQVLNFKHGSNGRKISRVYLAQKGHRDAGTEEFAEMFRGELAKGFNDMRFDGVGGLFRIIGEDGDDLRRKVGVVNRIVDRYRDLKARTAVDQCTSDTSPHRLKTMKRSACRLERSGRWFTHLETGDGSGPDGVVQAGQSTPGGRREF